VAAIFLPFYLCVGTAALTDLYILLNRRRVKEIFRIRHVIWLPVFILIAMITGVCFGNYTGLLQSLVILSYTLFALFVQTEITEKISGGIVDICCALSMVCMLIGYIQVKMRVDPRAFSTFFNANYFATICEFAILLSIYGFYRNQKHRWFYLAALLVNFYGIQISMCRTAWPAVFCGIVVLLFCLRRYKPLMFALSLIVLALVLLVVEPKLIVPRFYDFTRQFAQREAIWLIAFHGFLQSPLFGQGSMAYYFISTGDLQRVHAHNIYLEALLNYGVVNTLVGMLFIAPHFAGIVKNARRTPTDALKLGTFAVVLVHGLTDVTVSGFQTGLLFLVICAMTYQKEELYRQESYLVSIPAGIRGALRRRSH
jgi:O-antigen ligase